MQKQQNWAQLVAHGIYMHDSFIASPALLKEDIKSFNSGLTIQGTPRWLAKREKLVNVYKLPLARRYASIVFAVESEEEKKRLLKERAIAIALSLIHI